MKRKPKTPKKSNPIGQKILAYTGRFFLWLFSTLFVLLIGLYIFLLYINKGPSPYVRDLFVASVMESSAGGIMAKIYLSDEEIAAIQEKNNTASFNEVTDTTLINIVAQQDAALHADGASSNTSAGDHSDAEIFEDGIEVYEVRGRMYYGKIMIIQDPSRVKLAVIDNFSIEGRGLTLLDLVAKYDCVAGVNGGKYEDESGLGSGSLPEGIVISEGKLLLGNSDTAYDLCGLTNDNVLVVGTMTASHAISIGIRDAVSFGPALIINGKSAGYSGIGSGLNPRTAIGQREDGAILLLVIEGRQTSSMGASMSDLIEVMLEYGAVNAYNLDGGMSSSMVYEDEEIINNCVHGYARRIPTAFVVERNQ